MAPYTCDPYAILVSEFMLQQTQVATVIPYYEAWLRRFPNFASLARASENDVLRSWQGLGYYARARNLHATARAVLENHRGRFPQSIDRMRRLPGIGKYTANAVASFAFDRSVPIVETNTTRVLARLFDFRKSIDSSSGRKTLWQHAARLLPKSGARTFNSALLDLGALICVARNPTMRSLPGQRVLPGTKSGYTAGQKIETPDETTRRNSLIDRQAWTDSARAIASSLAWHVDSAATPS